MVCFFIFLGRGELREEEEREDSVRREKKSRCGGLFLFFIVDFRKGYSWNYFVKIVFFILYSLALALFDAVDLVIFETLSTQIRRRFE